MQKPYALKFTFLFFVVNLCLLVYPILSINAYSFYLCEEVKNAFELFTVFLYNRIE